MKTRTPDLLGMSYACANMVHCPGYADDLRQYTTLNSTQCCTIYHVTNVLLSLPPAMDYRYQILLHSTRPLSNQLRVGVELLGGSFPPPRLNFPGITASSHQYWCDMEVACEGQTRTATAICETDIASKSASLWFPIHNHRPVFPVMALPMALLQEQPTTVTTRIRFCN